MTADEWISSFADRIGAQSPSPEEIGEILGLAAIAATPRSGPQRRSPAGWRERRAGRSRICAGWPRPSAEDCATIGLDAPRGRQELTYGRHFRAGDDPRLASQRSVSDSGEERCGSLQISCVVDVEE